jgi:hypothetical protein
MAVERSFIVKLLADPKELIKGFSSVKAQAEDTFGGANTKIQSLVPSFQKVAAASAVAFAGLTAAAGLSISEAIKAQAEQDRLRQILLTTGGASEKQVEALIAQADALEKVGVASAGAIITAQSQLATFDLQFETIQRLTPAITDYVIAEKGATASTEDFKSMTNSLAQALGGNFTALTKSGFQLDETTKSLIKNGTEAERSAALVDVLNSTYKGFNEAARQTAQGQLVALRNSFNAVRTEIGIALIPAFEAAIGLLQKFADFVQKNTGLIVTIGITIGAMTGTVVLLSLAMKVLATVTAAAALKLTLFGVALSATGIFAIVVVVGLLISAFVNLMFHSEKARNVMKTLINFVIKGFEMVVNAVIGVINSVIQWGNVFNGILRAVGFNVGSLERIAAVSFKGIGNSISGAADEADNFANKIEIARQRIRQLDEKGLVTVADATNKVAKAEAEVNRLRKLQYIPLEQLKKATDDLKNSQADLALLTGENGKKSVGGATKEAIKPLQEYTKVLKQAQSQSDAFGRAQKRVTESQLSVAEANDALAFARAELDRVQRAGSEGEIIDATRAVAAAERGLTRAQFGQEEAAIAVRDAERRLADIRADEASTADQIRRAEIALAEAKFNIVDAEDNQIKSTRGLAEARRQLRITTDGLKQGDAELLPFQKAVTDAQKAQTRASEEYQEALKAQTEALKEYKDALKELADAAGKFPGVAGRVGAPGLIPTVPGVPEPVPVYTPQQESQLAQLNVTVQAGLATDGAEVGRVIADYLRDFTRIAGPLQAYGLVT